jgi:hypothetical protein
MPGQRSVARSMREKTKSREAHKPSDSIEQVVLPVQSMCIDSFNIIDI